MKKITVKIEDVYVEEQYTFVNYLWQDVPVASHAQGGWQTWEKTRERYRQ